MKLKARFRKQRKGGDMTFDLLGKISRKSDVITSCIFLESCNKFNFCLIVLLFARQIQQP